MNTRLAKRILFAFLMIGIAAYFGTSGTFANFSAETANPGSSIASGTLTMSDQVNSASACFSTAALSGDNTNNNCGAIFTSTSVAPGAMQASQIAKITLQNTGSINGANLYMYGSHANGILTGSDIHSGDTVHNITIGGGVEGIISVGDLVSLADGGNTQLFTVSATPTPAANSNGGATTVTVTSATATADFRAGHATLVDIDGNTTNTNTDCYDSKTSDGAAFGFNSITASTAYQAFNPMCGSLVIWVQESTGGNNYCWMGDGSPHSSATFSEAAYGLCVAPIASAVGGAGLSGTVTSIPVPGGINGNISSGDFINVTQGTLTQQFTASADATVGATSISVNSLALNAGFTGSAIGATITDPTKQGLLDAFYHTDSLTNFDLTARTELLPIAGTDAVTHIPYLDTSTTHAPDLASGGSRTFYIGVYLPKPAGSTQNNLQGLSSTFGITWLLNQ
jgi:hypothetical protein